MKNFKIVMFRNLEKKERIVNLLYLTILTGVFLITPVYICNTFNDPLDILLFKSTVNNSCNSMEFYGTILIITSPKSLIFNKILR